MSTYETGLRSEREAIRFLRENFKGLRLLCHRFSALGGEIDLIFEERHADITDWTLVFVEVRTRYSKKTIDPILSLTPKKVARIKRAAEQFLRIYRGGANECQFDFVVYDLGKWRRYENYF